MNKGQGNKHRAQSWLGIWALIEYTVFVAKQSICKDTKVI